jgi:hypothetical protein
MAGYLGQIFGALGFAAWPLDRFGPRRTLSAAVLGVTGCIFIQFFSQSIEVLYVGNLHGAYSVAPSLSSVFPMPPSLLPCPSVGYFLIRQTVCRNGAVYWYRCDLCFPRLPRPVGLPHTFCHPVVVVRTLLLCLSGLRPRVPIG